jgi:excisionase family DNA binding protein
MSTENLEIMAYTISQTSKVLNVHPNTTRKLIAERGLPAIRIGKKFIIPKLELQAWCSRNCNNNRPPAAPTGTAM